MSRHDLTAHQWKTAAATIVTNKGNRDDSIWDILDALNLHTIDEATAIYTTLISNESPCWRCGTGIGDNRVECYEDTTPLSYMHPTCAERTS